MELDEKLAHAREFTDIEDITLDVWLDLENIGEDKLAADLLDAGLMFEHYTSLLASNPADRTPTQLSTQDQLRQKWTLLLIQSQGVIAAAKPPEPAPGKT